MKLEDIKKPWFSQYERLRRSGVTNMLDWRTASECLGWDYAGDRDRYAAIIENYSELAGKWPDVVRETASRRRAV